MIEFFVYSISSIGSVGAWSRYSFPFDVDGWAISGDELYLRSGDEIHVMSEDIVGDEISTGEILPAEGVIQWPWLDFGAPGVTKSLFGFDVVGMGAVSVEVGYDQSASGAFTDPYTVAADTLPGTVIPLPLAAPSMSVRLTYSGAEPWQWNAFGLYLQDLRGMS